MVSLPELAKDVAEKIAERGHFICPYSNATKGDMEGETVLVDGCGAQKPVGASPPN